MGTHLSIRVPWHDALWDGTVCRDPSGNCHCVDYENVLKNKNTEWELTVVGKCWGDMDRIPPCAKESGGFLSDNRWTSSHTHPYRDIAKLKESHGHLETTALTVEPHTAYAVPFSWLNRQNVDNHVQPRMTEPLPPDRDFPEGFHSVWVFGPALQEAILDGFFAPVSKGVSENQSLAVFYTKGNHPVSDDVPRLVVGIGDITRIDEQRYYDAPAGSHPHPIWERGVGHSLRGDGSGGLLLPFHEYLAPTGDPDEDQRRRELARQIVVSPEPDRILEFSNRSEHVSADSVISVLTQAISSVHQIRDHGIADGNWAATESWLNERLARVWNLRGPHPGLGVVLEAMGLRLGTALCFSLAQFQKDFSQDPWATIRPILEGKADPPHERFRAELDSFRSTWGHIATQSEKLDLAKSLTRFSLTAEQARRWWDSDKRAKSTGSAVDDEAIIANPYLLIERDLGGGGSDQPVSFPTVDRGMLSDLGGGPSIASGDRRRRRAALSSVLLRRASSNGDTLLGFAEARSFVAEIPVQETVELPQGWMEAEKEFLDQCITVQKDPFEYVQLKERAALATLLQRKLAARARRKLPTKDVSWRELLIRTIQESSGESADLDLGDERIEKSLNEQQSALQRITSRKLTCLVGRAGTGKTTVLGALSRAPDFEGDLLFLAPTGKARVRLESRVAEGTSVMTVAQFLYGCKRYDGRRQRPVVGEPCYDGHQTIVIDESSMLTEDDLAAVVSTFTNRVKRLILVGDPAQLPPIGPGRPFADLVAFLDPLNDEEDEDPDDVERRRGAIARLRQEVRTVAGTRSDTLRLANWFTGDKPAPDAESIFSSLTDGSELNDLDVRFWTTPEQLHKELTGALREHLAIEGADDLKGFNKSFLMEPFKKGWTTGDPDGAERWQILSPVRGDVWGCDDVNRWVKLSWRGKALGYARQHHATFGPQEILKHDKVILLRNGEREGYSYKDREKKSAYLANGEVALAKIDKRVETANGKAHVMNLVFSGRPKDQSFGFWKNEFGGETGVGIIELAYALTVHKAQGSEFGVVIVILPSGRMAYRELVYTALTRSRENLVLLVQGNDVSDLLSLRHPSASDTNRRNSNIFRTSVRDIDSRPFAHHLVHRAEDGTLLRSKSELFIYTQCLANGLRPRYEERFDGSDRKWKLPDFTFEDDAGDPVIWEHLGMMDDPQYALDWDKKKKWYGEQGISDGENLFCTDEVGGLDAGKVNSVIAQIKEIAG